MEDRKGQAATAEELFDHCLTLANISAKSLEETHAIRDEVRRALKAISENHQEALGQVSTLSIQVGQQGAKLQSMYAPELVKDAAVNAQKAVKEFENKAGGIFDSIRIKANGLTHVFWLRTLGAVVVGSAALVMLFVLLYWLTPNIDEIKSRQAELEQTIDGLNAIKGVGYIRAKNGRFLVFPRGYEEMNCNGTKCIRLK